MEIWTHKKKRWNFSVRKILVLERRTGTANAATNQSGGWEQDISITRISKILIKANVAEDDTSAGASLWAGTGSTSWTMICLLRLLRILVYGRTFTSSQPSRNYVRTAVAFVFYLNHLRLISKSWQLTLTSWEERQALVAFTDSFFDAWLVTTLRAMKRWRSLGTVQCWKCMNKADLFSQYLVIRVCPILDPRKASRIIYK